MIEKDFVTEGLRRTRIDEYLEKELERAGYGGMDVQITPLGTMVIVYAERPGMVIGRGGKNVRTITQTLTPHRTGCGGTFQSGRNSSGSSGSRRPFRRKRQRGPRWRYIPADASSRWWYR